MIKNMSYKCIITINYLYSYANVTHLYQKKRHLRCMKKMSSYLGIAY